MAPEDDFWTRKRKEEEKAEEEERERKRTSGEGTVTSLQLRRGPEVTADLLKKFEELLRRVPVSLDQLDNLYRHYVQGFSERPPAEERLRLEQMMTFLVNIPKATPADRYRFSSIWSSYIAHKTRWEKLLRDLETGKVIRVGKKH